MATIIKILLTLALVWAILRVVPTLILLLFAILLAVTLSPLVERMEKKGISRAVAVGIVTAALVLIAAAVVIWLVPPLVSQTAAVIDNFHALKARAQGRVGPDHPVLARLVTQILELPDSPEVARSLKGPLFWGQFAVETVAGGAMLFIIALYLLADGKRTYAWLLAYVPRRHRRKMGLMLPEVSQVVISYVQGQIITSTLLGGYALVVLTLLHVPAAIPLAVLAAICDVLPVVGVIISIAPAMLFALTVSPLKAAAVFALYLAYHALENSVIIPRVYGQRLRVSTPVVLMALLLGGSLYGVVGAVLALPLVAAYPIVERIWLHEYLSDEVVADHAVLERAAEEGSDQAVDAVLKGEKHAAEREEAAHEARREAQGREAARPRRALSPKG
ncbi:MAG TPA: AI-2E family transporter [Thermoanaerobaculia bacterium]|nr:AI-2E family transporter [Thermoanaerobaculia bacterium]